ncbi:MAG TPA: UDP-N-acetylmuramoyl-L-alanyl-D-glutamate--2,6-diaminopimelate ligase [Longimicrobiales bacterium]|nr:UDP-N-acetylmuramoyl-L-alanyl-D-glutamate--2,6-diaminopimelate ligase [Longimicrobiales bacterium]
MSGPVRLRELAGRLEDAGLLVFAPVALDTRFTGIADDSRLVQPGDLFCAWAGTISDGHDYVEAAVERGAAAILLERPLPGIRVPQVVTSDGRRACGMAAALCFGDPQDALTTVAVTGTNGKTTSVWMLRHLLGLHEPTASIGTLGAVVEDGAVLPGSETLTTPGPVQLASTLRTLVDRGVRSLAMEVSSHALDQGRVAALRYDVALFTNLTRDHLDYHGTMEHYRGAKRSLVALLRADGTAVINSDEPAWQGLAEQAPRTLTFGTAPDAEVRFEDVTLDASGASFTLVTPDGAAQARIPLLGGFNVQNAVGATAACLGLDFDLADLIGGLATIPQVPGRLERIADRPCPVLRDYAHTPDALERVLAALRPLTAGRMILVFGAGGDRDRGKRPLMGTVAEHGADVVIVTSDNPRTESPEAIIDDIMAGMQAGRATRIVDRREAIAHALAIAGPDDMVLLAGKGHETYQVTGIAKHPFDELEIVHDLLRGGLPGVGA